MNDKRITDPSTHSPAGQVTNDLIFADLTQRLNALSRSVVALQSACRLNRATGVKVKAELTLALPLLVAFEQTLDTAASMLPTKEA